MTLASLENWIGMSLAKLVEIWRFTLFEVDQRPITVANIVVGFLLIGFGYWTAKVFTRFVARRLLPRLDLNLAQRATFESVVFYFSFFFATLFALNMANVPLTSFTLLGGALAIGVGFGSQNVVNNFISGVILMIEQPVKVGDIIELGALRGVVEHIGARSTRIRSFTNTHIIVPNSSFLQENVVNWTLADDIVKICVTLGVAYGSPVDKVKALLEKAVKEEPRALAQPSPLILFKEFGDNALIFDTYLSVRMKNHLERMEIESALRFKIDRLFREAGVVIAFPQRDIHLDTTAPIDVRIQPSLSSV